MIRVAQLVAEIAAAGEGIHSAWRCRVRFADNTQGDAYVKDVPPRRMVAEIVAATLAEQLALPVAEPILVIKGDAVLFGAVAVAARTFRVALQSGGEQALVRLRAWPSLMGACGFDDWVANPDRNMGNMLHDGNKMFWLIDHEFALADGLLDDALTANHLHLAACGGASVKEIDVRLRPARLAVAQAQSVAALKAVADRLNDLPLPHAGEMLDFLRRRQSHLRALVLQRMPLAQGDIFDDRTH